MKVTVWIMTDKVGSKMQRTIEVDGEEWADMNDRERDEYVWEEIQNRMWIEWGYQVAD